MIERVGLKDEAQILIPAICNRLNKTPFPEPCKKIHFNLNFVLVAEEVRVALVELLELCLETDKH